MKKVNGIKTETLSLYQANHAFLASLSLELCQAKHCHSQKQSIKQYPLNITHRKEKGLSLRNPQFNCAIVSMPADNGDIPSLLPGHGNFSHII